MPTVTLRPIGNHAITFDPRPPTQTNFQCVDEETPNDSVDYCALVGQAGGFVEGRDLYNLNPSGLPSGTKINSVTVYWRARKVQAYPITCRGIAKIKTHDIEYSGAVATLTTSWVTRSHTWTKNPFSGLDWTVEEVDSLKAGNYFYVQSEDAEAENTIIYVVVDYVSAVVGVSGDGLVWHGV